MAVQHTKCQSLVLYKCIGWTCRHVRVVFSTFVLQFFFSFCCFNLEHWGGYLNGDVLHRWCPLPLSTPPPSLLHLKSSYKRYLQSLFGYYACWLWLSSWFSPILVMNARICRVDVMDCMQWQTGSLLTILVWKSRLSLSWGRGTKLLVNSCNWSGLPIWEPRKVSIAYMPDKKADAFCTWLQLPIFPVLG